MMRKLIVIAVAVLISRSAICETLLQAGADTSGQTGSGGAATLVDKLPAMLETHQVSRTDTVWFGKWKSRIEGYADVVRKEGVITSDFKTHRDHEETRVKFKVALDLAGNDASTANAKGQLKKSFTYQEYTNFFDDLLYLTTEIESSTTLNWQSQSVFTATVVTSFNPRMQWALHFETATGADAPPGQGSLSNGVRTMSITPAENSGGNGKSYLAHRFDFVENGQSLGTMGIDAYSFMPGIEAETKLLLATAMEAVWVASFRPHSY